MVIYRKKRCRSCLQKTIHSLWGKIENSFILGEETNIGCEWGMFRLPE